uniref:Uncharacterized protein n=1 Tax=Salix viminalis TaxID=40686 RepID=A0A6N2NIU5_SALVM
MPLLPVATLCLTLVHANTTSTATNTPRELVLDIVNKAFLALTLSVVSLLPLLPVATLCVVPLLPEPSLCLTLALLFFLASKGPLNLVQNSCHCLSFLLLF